MPRPSEEVQRPRALPTDPAIPERYVMGTLAVGALAAYEASVQGNPASFAELVDFKNAFFGRSKFVSSHRVPEPPCRDRDELRVLALRAIDGQTFLTWRPASESGLHVQFLRADAVTPYQGSSAALESLLAVEAQLRDLQYELNDRLERLRAQILMATQAGNLPPLVKLRDAMGETIQEQDRLTERLCKLREQVADTLSRRTVERLEEEEGGPWSRGYEIETRLARHGCHQHTAVPAVLIAVRSKCSRQLFAMAMTLPSGVNKSIASLAPATGVLLDSARIGAASSDAQPNPANAALLFMLVPTPENIEYTRSLSHDRTQ